MTKILILLLILLGISTTLNASPTEQDRQEALKLMYLDSTDQELHFYNNNNYESVTPKWVSGLVHYTCSYSTFSGKGYILSVIKVENGKVWRIQRHEGPESLSINTQWTCVNCSGEFFNFPVINEHGLCEQE